MKLVFVDRDYRKIGIFLDGNQRREPRMLELPEVNTETDLPCRSAPFFIIEDDRDEDSVLQYLTRTNPGCEVKIFELTRSGICPAGEMVEKRITKDGELPA
jgi:hypothetical protein